MDNNPSGGRGSRDSDSWSGRGGGRDSDKWGGRGGGRDSEGWGGRGNRASPWRGNGNRRRNEDWEGSNQKRWRRDDNSEWDEQQKPWKQRGSLNDDDEWPNKQGSQWAGGKNNEGNYSKFKNRDNNEERPRKPSKWGDKEADDKVKEDRWSRKSVEHSKDESNAEEGAHQTSAPMDLDNYDGESSGKIEQLPEAPQDQNSSNTNQESNNQREFENEQLQGDTQQEHHNPTSFTEETNNFDQNNISCGEQPNNDNKSCDKDYNNFSNNVEDTQRCDVEQTQQNMEVQFQDNFEQKNVEEKQPDQSEPHNLYQIEDRHNDSNSQCEYETHSNNEKFEENQQIEPEYNSTNFENKQSNPNQSFGHKEPQISIQEEFSINNFGLQANKINNEKCIEEVSAESQGNLYFGGDCRPSIDNNVIETEQQNNEMLSAEGSAIIIQSENHEAHAINIEEPNQS